MALQNVLVLDGETTTRPVGDHFDPTPFHPDNKLVSMHWLKIQVDPTDVEQMKAALALLDETRDTIVDNSVFFHVEKLVPDTPAALQEALDWADVLVAHNAKFDKEWLQETNFRLPEQTYCTMIGEYAFSRGRQNYGLSLEESALRRGVTHKKSDLIKEEFNEGKGKGFEEITLATVLEYGDGDVITCAEIYINQLIDFHDEEHTSLQSVTEFMNDMLDFIVEIETNGIRIDLDALSEVETEFVAEKKEIEARLTEIVEDVMGDTPINLASGADLSKVIYSREVTNKELHKQMFNLGRDARGRQKYPPRMKKHEFAGAVRATTKVLYKTVAVCCPVCKGSGQQYKVTKAGVPYKKQPKCRTCSGEGVVYDNTGRKAGLRLVPEGPRDASVHGFKADGDTIKKLTSQAIDKDRLQAAEFLQKLSRLNAISTYLSSFIGGIRTWTRRDLLLHANFNQCIAATGRLSCSKPNFQNQPKSGKFPVRKAIVSRFLKAYFDAHNIPYYLDPETGEPVWGEILEADFSGLEFRVAGDLSRDAQIIADILDGKDIHAQTASIINQCTLDAVSKEIRQAAKPYTFGPLYGGMGANEPEHVQKYFKEFFNIYEGLRGYQKILCDTAIATGRIQTPSGRQYQFDGVKRLRGGRVTQQTQIVNFPVQGFAADLVMLACIRALKGFREKKLRSKLILTVHDSIVVDVFPGEKEAVKEILVWAMTGVPDEAKRRWGHEFCLPLAVEIESGANWMTMKELDLPEQSYEPAEVRRDHFEDDFDFT